MTRASDLRVLIEKGSVQEVQNPRPLSLKRRPGMNSPAKATGRRQIPLGSGSGFRVSRHFKGK